MTTRFVVIGDIHQRFAVAAAHVARVVDAFGPVDFVVAVGDVQPNRDEADLAANPIRKKHRVLGDFPAVVAGEIDFPAARFLGGNHEPWPLLDELGAGEWAPGWTYLGRAGVTDLAGVTAGYLSGIGRLDGAVLPRAQLTGRKAACYFALEDLQALRAGAARRPLDVLVTHDWPSGIEPPDLDPTGSPAIRQLVEELRPTLHICGHLHLAHRARIGDTRVICLDKVARDRPHCVAVFEKRETEMIEVRSVTSEMHAPSSQDDASPDEEGIPAER